jgi:hypothetical protein
MSRRAKCTAYTARHANCTDNDVKQSRGVATESTAHLGRQRSSRHQQIAGQKVGAETTSANVAEAVSHSAEAQAAWATDHANDRPDDGPGLSWLANWKKPLWTL